MSELGDLLKARREGLNKSYTNIRDAICINPKFIMLIEEGRFAEMPSYLHSFGFVKKYSQHLGFNYDVDIKPLFDKECPKDATMESENVVVPHIDNPVQTTSSSSNTKLIDKALQDTNADKVPFNFGRLFIITIIVVLVVIAIGLGIYYVYANNDKVALNIIKSEDTEYKQEPISDSDTNSINEESNMNSNEMKELQPIEQGENINLENVEIDNNTNPQSLFSPIGSINAVVENSNESNMVDSTLPRKVEFRFTGRCWVQYTSDTGESKELSANERDIITFTFNNTFTIHIGNAAAVTMIFDGKTYSRFGAEDKPRRITYKYEDGELKVQG